MNKQQNRTVTALKASTVIYKYVLSIKYIKKKASYDILSVKDIN